MTTAAVRSDLEALLRARHLDRTLTTAQPWEQPQAPASPANPAGVDSQLAPTGIAELDARLGGGWRRGELSEIVGPRSSGRTSLLLASLAAATSRGEAVALIDACDTLDVASAAAAGVALTRMLWVREGVGSGPWAVDRASCETGRAVARPSGHWPLATGHSLDRAIKAFNIVLQAGGFGVVALDLADMTPEIVRGLPYTTWMRLQRVLLGTSTASLVVASEPVARSARGVTVDLGTAPECRSDVTGPSTG
ncbi:MAG: hypothetical protein HY654_12230, partial [Acidobacteria bacterium]|nr:hypothetical protein [Acidobacteriota bacterium]